MGEEEAQPLFRLRRKRSFSERSELSASEVGTTHHTFLEFVSLRRVGSEIDLRQEAERIRDGSILSTKEIAALDFSAIASFWSSDVGRKILEHTENIQREHPFTSRFRGNDFARIGLEKGEKLLADDFVVLQGVIDIAVILPSEIWLLDFKTDQINEPDLEGRLKYYRLQLVLYAEALSKIYQRPVTHRWLHFLALQKTISLSEN
jgi:ATP-dependent helicase/nuclease subunit A